MALEGDTFIVKDLVEIMGSTMNAMMAVMVILAENMIMDMLIRTIQDKTMREIMWLMNGVDNIMDISEICHLM